MVIHFEWTKEMSVGEDAIDAQHQLLLKQLNSLFDIMASKATRAEVEKALNFLEKYITEHFAYEEQYLKKRGYAELKEHKKYHDDFRKKYESFKTKVQSGTISLIVLIEIEEFLGEWWVQHITSEDRKYFLAFGTKE